MGTAGDKRTNLIFNELQREKKQIEASFDVAESVEFQWMQDDGTNRSGVHAGANCSIDDPPAKLEDTRTWMIEFLLKFRAAFEPRLEKILDAIPGDDG